jgi:hypothetical protein
MLPSQTNSRRGQHQPQNYRQTSSKTNIVQQNQNNDENIIETIGKQFNLCRAVVDES